MNKWHEKEINEMLKKVSNVKNEKELKGIFDVILTPREINDMARRLKALELLEKGDTYSDIQTRLGLSSGTVSRISGKIGFGFRRNYSSVGKKSDIKQSKKGIKYKGVAPLKEVAKSR